MRIAALCGLAGLLLALPRGDETLVPGKPLKVELRAKDEWRKRFVLDVPAEAIALRCSFTSASAELGLHADWRELSEDTADSRYQVHSDGGRAELAIDRFGEHPLHKGRLFLELAWEGEGAPESADRRLESLECTLEARVFAPATEATLAMGAWLPGAIPPRASGTRSYKIEFPAGAKALRIDLDGAQADLDLYARSGKPVGALDGGVRFARHLYGRESLVLGDDEALGTDAWFVDVVDISPEEGPVAFRIGVHAGLEAPAELVAIPPLPASFPGALGKSLPCVVELFASESSGSGTLVSEQGWILTNAHVVTAVGGGRERELVVACTLDPREPPLELFRAEVVEFDEARDLALLRIARGFYGQMLPHDYRFPRVELGDPNALAIGDPLYLVGYPSTGGMGSLVTLHCTRGILAGFDRAPTGIVLKTDAGITGGNSGGAALDERGKLIGIPTMMVEDASGQAGFVHPWTWMPESWRKHLAASEKR